MNNSNTTDPLYYMHFVTRHLRQHVRQLLQNKFAAKQDNEFNEYIDNINNQNAAYPFLQKSTFAYKYIGKRRLLNATIRNVKMLSQLDSTVDHHLSYYSM